MTQTVDSAPRVVEFGLLGPFEVRADGRLLGIGSGKYRTLLAMLVLRAGQPVPVWALAEAIWADDQPVNPRRAVQLYVTRVRQLLGGGIIRTHPEGYQIDVPLTWVDFRRFEQWLGVAEQAASRGDLDAEAEALGKALAQWRGEPLAAVPSERLHQEDAPRLQELRLQAFERLSAVEMRRGRHAAVIGELSVLTAQHPMRERLWALLMTALHKSGRRADALSAYNRMRQALADELGIEPSQDLQELHAMILTGGSAVRPAMWPPVPRQLPPDPLAFSGREEELARLDELLDSHRDDQTMVTIVSGMAGIGKTVLASHWARRAADRFPDGQLWVNLQGYGPGPPLGPEQALNRFLRALGTSDAEIPVELPDRIGLYRTLMDGRRMLIVLDNAADTAQVRPLLPGAPGSLVIVTSRKQMADLVVTEVARQLILDLLTRGEARKLLVSRLGTDRIARDSEAVEEIIDLCARLPLALAIIAARAATHPEFGLDTLAAELRGARGGLDAFAGPHRASGVRAAFASSYHALEARAALLFRLLGLHPGPDISATAAASLVGVPLEQVRGPLLELCDAHLLTEHSPGRFALHDLLRAYATELTYRLDPAQDQRQAIHRVFDHYLHTARQGALLLEPWVPVDIANAPHPGVTVDDFAGHRQALTWYRAEHHVLLAVVQQAAEAGFSAHTWLLAWTLVEYLYRQGHWHDWALVLRIAQEAACQNGTGAVAARTHRELARAYTRLGHLDTAEEHCKRALELADEDVDPIGHGLTHRVFSMLLADKGLLGEALCHDRQALEAFIACGHRNLQARSLNAIGWILALLGDHQQALDHCRRALDISRERGDRRGQAATLDSLGYIHHHLGHYDEAIARYRESLNLFRDIGDRSKEADDLAHLGDAHLAAGSPAAARTAWQQALDIFSELGPHVAEPVRAKLRSLDGNESAREDVRR